MAYWFYFGPLNLTSNVTSKDSWLMLWEKIVKCNADSTWSICHKNYKWTNFLFFKIIIFYSTFLLWWPSSFSSSGDAQDKLQTYQTIHCCWRWLMTTKLHVLFPPFFPYSLSSLPLLLNPRMPRWKDISNDPFSFFLQISQSYHSPTAQTQIQTTHHSCLKSDALLSSSILGSMSPQSNVPPLKTSSATVRNRKLS